jgi:VanZ family protein
MYYPSHSTVAQPPPGSLELYTGDVALKFGPRQRRWLRILWLAAVAAVMVGSLLPGSSLPIQALGKLQVSDKLMHFAAYAVLAFLPSLHERWPALAATLAGAISLGVLLEFGQMLSPGRNFEIADMVADTVGVLCGLILALPWRS